MLEDLRVLQDWWMKKAWTMALLSLLSSLMRKPKQFCKAGTEVMFAGDNCWSAAVDVQSWVKACPHQLEWFPCLFSSLPLSLSSVWLHLHQEKLHCFIAQVGFQTSVVVSACFCSSCVGMDLWGGREGMGGGQWLCLGCVCVLSFTGGLKKMFNEVVFATFHFPYASALPLHENRN